MEEVNNKDKRKKHRPKEREKDTETDRMKKEKKCRQSERADWHGIVTLWLPLSIFDAFCKPNDKM